LIGIGLGVVAAVTSVPVVYAVVVGAPTAMVVLLVTAVVLIDICLFVYLGVAWSLAVPAYVLEDISMLASFGRSFHLVRRQWWRVFAILLLGKIIAGALGLVLGVPFSIIGQLVSGPANPGQAVLPYLVITAIGAIIVGTVVTPFTAGITGLLYIDQRIRREGMDIELARVAEASRGPAPE
ncbi:MAG: hypothetical protein J2P19_23215, partial [Pseudonocardia sp.]|nr:hypothetical protein [Pseudonocardia sp.]